MSIRITQELAPKPTQEMGVLGGITLSVFQKSESWLLESSNHQEVIQKVGHPRRAKRYQSLMDFLFCELFVKFRKPCFAFYEEEGPPLRDIITKEEIETYDGSLLRIFHLAYDLCNTEKKLSWKRVLELETQKAS